MNGESLWVWFCFNAAVVFFISFDLLVLHRKNNAISIQRALIESACWITAAMLFNVFIWIYRGSGDALDFLTGYLIEESLSIDNLFVFIMIFDYFRTPKEYQYKALFWGILGAIVMRALFIYFGLALVHKFSVIFYFFGIFLIYTGIKMATSKDEEIDPEHNFVINIIKKFIPTTTEYSNGNFFTKINGRKFATPLFITLISIEMTDVIFALDSIPAIMGITLDPFIIYTSNIFAILGLRSFYFALSGFLPLFRFLKYGLAAILTFVGLKMLFAGYVHVPIFAALGFIVLALVTSILASLWVPANK